MNYPNSTPNIGRIWQNSNKGNIVMGLLGIWTGTPHYQFIAFYITFAIAKKLVSANVHLVNLFVMLSIMAIIGIIRIIIAGIIGNNIIESDGYSSKEKVFISLCKYASMHWWHVIWIISVIPLVMPIEGNIFGFLYYPIYMITSACTVGISLKNLSTYQTLLKEIH